MIRADWRYWQLGSLEAGGMAAELHELLSVVKCPLCPFR
jgi:hypothetical protein